MKLKAGSVRVASMFGRIAIVALTSPAARFAVRAATSGFNVVATVARRFVRR